MTVVRVAFTQATWTGDKESMIALHEAWTREAASQGAQIIAFQELFYGPYFGITQDTAYYDYAESVPGPTTERFAALAKELGIVIVLPVYEEEQPGVLYNTAAVIDADGSYLGKYRKHHIPNLPKFWEKFYFRPGNLGYPVFETAVGKIGVNICYDRHFPEGWRVLALNGARDRVQPERHGARASRTSSGRSSSPPPRWPTATSSSPTTAWGSRTTSTATRPSTSTARRTRSARTATTSARSARRARTS